MTLEKFEKALETISQFSFSLSSSLKRLSEIVVKCQKVVKERERFLRSLINMLIRAIDANMPIELDLIPIIVSRRLNYFIVGKYIYFKLQFDKVLLKRDNIRVTLSEIDEVIVPSVVGAFPININKLFQEYFMVKDAIFVVENDKVYVLGIPHFKHFSLDASPSDDALTATRFIRAVAMINLVYNINILVSIASKFISTNNLDSVSKKITSNTITISDSTLLKL